MRFLAGFAIIAPCRNGGPEALRLDYKEGGWALFWVGTILACHAKGVPRIRQADERRSKARAGPLDHMGLDARSVAGRG